MTNTSTAIEYFKKEAKRLFRRVEAKDSEALSRVLRVLKDPSDIRLMRVQHVIAVEYGYSKWEDLVTAPAEQLQAAIKTRVTHSHLSNQRIPKPWGTPLGNFLRGTGILPTPPHLEKLADKFDQMTMEEQRLFLDQEALAMGLFDHR